MIAYLDQAKAWLVQATELDDVCEAKSRAAAIQVYLAQKQLGKEAELAAAELVRRAERRIDQLVQEGKEHGDFSGPGRPQEKNGTRGSQLSRRSPRELIPPGKAGAEIRLLGRDSSDEQFEDAVAEAREEQNLSRANVARKLKRSSDTAPNRSGKRSAWHYRTHHLDSTRIFREMAIALDALATNTALVEVTSLDPEVVDHWADSVKQSLSTLNRFTKEVLP
jgi:hypothetical protein